MGFKISQQSNPTSTVAPVAFILDAGGAINATHQEGLAPITVNDFDTDSIPRMALSILLTTKLGA